MESFEIINEDISMIKSRLGKIRWLKPIYVGFAVLDLSKLYMYTFHYETVKPMYGTDAKLLFTDTDSLCYELKTKDVVSDFARIADLLDTSDYSREHPLYSPRNAKVIGKFKDELAGGHAIQFVGLRSKMYSLLMPDGKNKATVKGVKLSYTKKHLRHAEYLKCLTDCIQTRVEFQNIRSRNHVLHTETVRKVGLSAFDDKRYLLPNTFDTLVHGHWRIANL